MLILATPEIQRAVVVILALLRSLLGLILILAAVSKLLNRRILLATVQAYRILPEPCVVWFCRVLPLSELLIGTCLLLKMLEPWSEVAAALLFGLFSVAISINLLQGRRNLSCGCWGTEGKGQIGWALVARNFGFIGAAAACAGPHWMLCIALSAVFVASMFLAVNSVRPNLVKGG